jgi:hypothetical protein
MSSSRNFVLFVLFCTAAFCALAQDPGKTSTSKEVSMSEDAIPHYTLEFGKPRKTTLGGSGTVMGGITSCDEAGTIFFEVADAQSDHMGLLALHSLDPSGQSIRFSPGHVPGYIDPISQPLRFFASDTRVVALVMATPVKASLSDPQPDWVEMALIYDRKGALQKAVRLPGDSLQVTALGLYESGNLLAIGVDIRDRSARLLVVDQSGDTVREIRLFDEDYNLSKNAQQDQMLSSMVQNKSGALGMMKIVPYGKNLLLLPTFTRQPIIEVNEHGIVRVYPLQIPDGLFLGEPLSISRKSWKFNTSGGGFKVPQKDEEDVPKGFVIKPGPVLIFNPNDGSVLGKVEKSADGPKASLVCEHDGEYTALTSNRDDGTVEILKASIPQ